MLIAVRVLIEASNCFSGQDLFTTGEKLRRQPLQQASHSNSPGSPSSPSPSSPANGCLVFVSNSFSRSSHHQRAQRPRARGCQAARDENRRKDHLLLLHRRRGTVLPAPDPQQHPRSDQSHRDSQLLRHAADLLFDMHQGPDGGTSKTKAFLDTFFGVPASY